MDEEVELPKISIKAQIDIVESVLEIAAGALARGDLSTIHSLRGIILPLFYHDSYSPIDMIYVSEYLLHLDDEITKGDSNYEWSSEMRTEIEENIQRARDLHHPDSTKQEKALLDEKCLPIHAKMVKRPEDSPRLFITLAETLDTLIKNGEITATSAAKELSHALDRPQIEQEPALEPAATIALEEMDYPGEIKTGDMNEVWSRFMKALPDNL